MVDLYQFGQEEEMASVNASGIGKIQKVHFDPYGIRFGGCNAKGDLNIWKFDHSLSDMAAPYIFIENCHSSSITDFTFLNSPNLLASIGTNSTPTLSLWDLLLPLDSSCIRSIDNLESVGVIEYCESLNILCIGSQKGKITRIDLRTNRVLDVTDAHATSIKSLFISGKFLYSGSRNGQVKVWDLTRMDSVDLGTHNHTDAASLLTSVTLKNFDMHLIGDGYLATTFEKTVAIWEQPFQK